MQKKPMKRKAKKKLAELGNTVLEMVSGSKIESMIRYDVDDAALGEWRNQGWQVVHYQFVDLSLCVVLERRVEDVPAPVNEPTVQVTPPLEAEAEVVQGDVISKATSVVDKLKEASPVFAALCNGGIDEVKSVLDAKVLEAARDAYDAALFVPAPRTRFESKLLQSGGDQSPIILETIEV